MTVSIVKSRDKFGNRVIHPKHFLNFVPLQQLNIEIEQIR